MWGFKSPLAHQHQPGILRTFGLADVLDCTSSLRHLGEGASSMEGSARAVVALSLAPL